MRRMPGFTAEATLYRSRGDYCTAAASAHLHAGWQMAGPIGVSFLSFGTPNSNWSSDLGESRAQLSSTAPPLTYFSPRRVPPPQAYAAYPWWAQKSFFRNCNGTSVNVMTDKHNCGACGNDCGNDGTGNIVDNQLDFCNNGSCATWERCPGFGDTLCGYQCADPNNLLTCKLARCRNLSTDPSNCGACGNQCAVGDVCCTGSCANLSTDPNNCGSCGNACTVAHGWGVCVGGICKIGGCYPPWADCNGIYADGCETDLSSNSNNCGACGHACGTNQTCCHSMCVNTQSFQTDVNNCGMCGIVCPPGYNCCAGVCSNPLMDDNNCGGCGKARCTGGQHCVNGGCVCPWPKSYCNNVCVDTNWDPNNCGGCDKIVPPGWTCCSGMPKDLTNDQYNCGSCGNTCPEGCSGGRTPCSNRKCGQVYQIACYFEDPNNKCYAGGTVYAATTVSEATTCAQRDPNHIGALVQCGVPPQQYSFAVWAPVDMGTCASGYQCSGSQNPLAFNSADATTCAQASYGGSPLILGGLNSSCGLFQCM